MIVPSVVSSELSNSTKYVFYTPQAEQAGAVTLQLKEKSLWVWNLRIEPEFRGKKLSHQLMSDILEISSLQEGVEIVYLNVFNSNHPARKDYLKAGFRTTQKYSLMRTMKFELKKEIV